MKMKFLTELVSVFKFISEKKTIVLLLLLLYSFDSFSH